MHHGLSKADIVSHTVYSIRPSHKIEGKKITQLGSNWNNGTNAEPFYWNLNNSVGNRNRNISGQLEYAIKLVDYQP